ncbi:MAG: type I-C CRISPR-associated endonuclease Cas1c [Bacteroidales bacterium]|nr:type I-C CRISPR-associated endonuclease Cas1c [Bacteroidales bacterium]
MRKLLNTLYVTTEDAYLTKDGENVVIRKEDAEIFRIPIHNIEDIVCFSYCGASPALMHLCSERGVGLSFNSANGRFLSRVSGAVRGNVLLRRTQYRIADDREKSLHIARIMIGGKIANSRNIVERVIRDHATESTITRLREASEILNIRRRQALIAHSADELRGIEGDAATSYFGVFDTMIRNKVFSFTGRNRRPPKDNVNALLSFIYTLLAHDVCSALESVGLDPYVGFLHTDRPGRASLALDMMEELRCYLADRLVLSLINRKQVNESDFKSHLEKGVIMTDQARKEVLTAWQKRKKEIISHPFLGEKVSIGLLPYIQAMLLARFLRNDLDDYPVFVLK